MTLYVCINTMYPFIKEFQVNAVLKKVNMAGLLVGVTPGSLVILVSTLLDLSVMTSNPVLSPEIAHPVFDLTGGNQWDQNPDPVQNGTLQEWSEPPPPYQQIPISTASNGSSPTIYNNVPNFNGNGNITYPPNSINMNQHPSTSYERNGTNNSIYTINGVRPPRNMLLPGMVRHNGYPTYHNGNTNYANIANNRYVHRAQGWVPTTKPSNGVKKQKRNRTAFTSHQMMELEQEYTRTRYLDRNRRIELSEILNLNQRTIKIWFQNRRMKEKKDRAESLEESEEVSTSESERSPDLSDIPLLIQDQYPVSVTASELYNRAGLYIDPMSYPITTQAGVLQPTLPQVPIQMPQDFIEYAPVENTYESIPLRQVHLQVQQYDNAFENGVQDLQQSDSGTASAQSSLNESWDLSWIRSIQIDEDI